MGTLMSNTDFHDVCYSAKGKAEIQRAIIEFLDEVRPDLPGSE
jgi:hypothetical protein